MSFPRTVRIKVRTTEDGRILAEPGVTLRNSSLIKSGVTRFDQLTDVVEGDAPQNGYVPVYDADTDKYVVQPIVVSVTEVDGGTF